MWIYPTDQTVFKTHSEIRMHFPGTSFPASITDATLAGVNVYPVAPVDPPPHDALTETLVEGTPTQIGGGWFQTWTVQPASAQEIAARQEAIRVAMTDRVQGRLDDFARTRGYDNIVSACSYATSTHVKYGPEGRYCVTAREDTWDVMFSIEAQVQAGLRPIPMTYEEIEAELPALEWPI